MGTPAIPKLPPSPQEFHTSSNIQSSSRFVATRQLHMQAECKKHPKLAPLCTQPVTHDSSLYCRIYTPVINHRIHPLSANLVEVSPLLITTRPIDTSFTYLKASPEIIVSHRRCFGAPWRISGATPLGTHQQLSPHAEPPQRQKELLLSNVAEVWTGDTVVQYRRYVSNISLSIDTVVLIVR